MSASATKRDRSRYDALLCPRQFDQVALYQPVVCRAPTSRRLDHTTEECGKQLAKLQRLGADLQNERIDAEAGFPERTQIVAGGQLGKQIQFDISISILEPLHLLTTFVDIPRIFGRWENNMIVEMAKAPSSREMIAAAAEPQRSESGVEAPTRLEYATTLHQNSVQVSTMFEYGV